MGGWGGVYRWSYYVRVSGWSWFWDVADFGSSNLVFTPPNKNEVSCYVACCVLILPLVTITRISTR